MSDIVRLLPNTVKGLVRELDSTYSAVTQQLIRLERCNQIHIGRYDGKTPVWVAGRGTSAKYVALAERVLGALPGTAETIGRAVDAHPVAVRRTLAELWERKQARPGYESRTGRGRPSTVWVPYDSPELSETEV